MNQSIGAAAGLDTDGDWPAAITKTLARQVDGRPGKLSKKNICRQVYSRPEKNEQKEYAAITKTVVRQVHFILIRLSIKYAHTGKCSHIPIVTLSKSPKYKYCWPHVNDFLWTGRASLGTLCPRRSKGSPG